jgi:pilus assembly protein CpaE
MQNVLRLAIVDPRDSSRDTLKNMLLGMDRVWLEAECSRYEFFADVVAQTQPELGIVSIDADLEKGLQLVAQLRETAPKCNILVVSSSTDGNVILRAMRAGAREFLTQPVRIEDLVAALERISHQFLGRGDAKSSGSTVIAVAGATGGVGTTSLAVNLGCYLAQEPSRSVALIDLDLCLGDADVFLDTIPDYTLLDVAQNVTRLDFTLLKRSLTKHASGLFLLPRPVQLEDVNHITPEDLNRAMGLLKATFTHLIVDLSKSYSAMDRVAMNLCTHLLLVTQLDLPCLRNVVRLMTSFNEIDGLADKVKIVVNRVGLDNGQISLKKAQDTIGREIYWQVPNEYQAMVQARNNGVPLLEHAPRSNVAQSMQLLAESLTGDSKLDASAKGKRLGGLLSLWGGKKAGKGG